MKFFFISKKLSILFASLVAAVVVVAVVVSAESVCHTCDFNFLKPGAALVNQTAPLLEHCNIMAALPFGTYYSGNQQVNVFNSEAVPNNNDKSDPDLATPHRSCPDFSKTKGRLGVGGRGEGGNYLIGTWPNCQGGQGNVLILQEVKADGVSFDYSKPNDGARGGCMFFAFADIPKHSLDFGLLDIDEPETAKITVRPSKTTKVQYRFFAVCRCRRELSL
jgi:hypothetical protein